MIYYWVVGGSTCQQVTESHWSSKNAMFSALAKSCCIPLVTMYPIYTTNSIILDGIGFIGTVPVPIDTSSVIISTLDILATIQNTIVFRSTELDVRHYSVPTIQPGTIYIFGRRTVSTRRTAYRHPLDSILRWCIFFYPYWQKYKWWWLLLTLRIISYRLMGYIHLKKKNY